MSTLVTAALGFICLCITKQLKLRNVFFRIDSLNDCLFEDFYGLKDLK